MRDADIRDALVRDVLAQHVADPGTLVRHELGIHAGARRVDIVVVNGEIAGWEIKSDEDTLARLAGQASAYGEVLDRITLVTTPKWERPAEAHVPEWWGLWVLEPGPQPDSVVVEQRRAPQDNSARVVPMALAQLLWREEALDELRRRGLAKGLSGRARHYVWERLAEAVPLGELRQLVRERLKERRTWPGGG